MAMRVLAIGRCSAHSVKGSESGQKIEKIPYLDVLPRSMKRKMGRLTKIMHAAVKEALLDRSLPDSIPLVVGTAYGDIASGLEVLQDIHDSKGSLLRPVKVQNSVHVSCSGYLSILLENRGTTLTISQGRLTAEASLMAMETLLSLPGNGIGIVVCGDLFDPAWISALDERAEQYRKLLRQKRWYEGAIALVLARQDATLVGQWKNAFTKSNWLIEQVFVKRLPHGSRQYRVFLDELRKSLSATTTLYTRYSAPLTNEDMLALQEETEKLVHQHCDEGAGTSMAGLLAPLVDAMEDWQQERHIAFLSREGGELGFLTAHSV